MKRMLALASALLLLLGVFSAQTTLGGEENDISWIFTAEDTIVFSYESETLRFQIAHLEYEGTLCFLTQVWMADPAQQIRKATAPWKQSLMYPSEMAQQIDGAALCINGSGYVSPVFPAIPENCPGTSADYYYTPLGSLTITDGEVFRNLSGVPYCGLTLEADGLQIYKDAENEEVLASSPTQTWSFYTRCPLVIQHESVLDTAWSFANAHAVRTVIARMEDGTYLLLTATSESGRGLTLAQVVEMLQSRYDPLWVYNLDGGPSSALLARRKGSHTLSAIYGNTSKDTDVMAFIELPSETGNSSSN